MPTSTLFALPVLHAGADLGEGAIWHPSQQLLYWIDINGCTLHVYNPQTADTRTWPTGARIGTVVPIEGSTDMLLALQTGICRMNLQTGKKEMISNPITDQLIRFNDGKCDPSGRFWVGTTHMSGKRKACALYRLDSNGSLHTMLEEVSISNGIVWTADCKTMYFIDTPTGCVQAFDYDDASGDITGQRIAFSIPPEHGDPDGMSIDSEGNLWIAMWGGNAVNCYHPQSGALLRQVNVPAPHTTSCAFGGPELKTLFITTARTELPAEVLQDAPLSGDLFAISTDVAGVPSVCYNPL